MKHVKLFENFIKTATIKYDLIKKLPEPDSNVHRYFINTTDKDKIAIIENTLIAAGCKFLMSNENDEDDLKSVFWYVNAKSQAVYKVCGMNHLMMIMKNESYKTVMNWKEVNFDEHFKLKPEFRGHNLKKFGV